MSSTRHQQGFTLLEVLIALTLMAVLSLLSWRALDVTTRSSERLNAGAHDTLALMRVLGQLETDLSRHADTGPSAEPTPASAQTIEITEGTILLPGIHWLAPKLTVHRTARPGTWQEVVWHVEDSRLRRAAGAPAATLPLPAARDGETLMSDVESFTVRAWLPGQGWTETFAAGGGRNATGLEIAIARRHESAIETYRKVVLLP